MHLHTLVDHLNQLLNPKLFRDYCPNGLQVEASCEINSIITGVTACEALIDAAIAQQADALLVHHGYFWKGEPLTVTGMKARRIQKLIKHNISLIAYHLPLDTHYQLGNNILLGNALGLHHQVVINQGVQQSISPKNTQLLFAGFTEPSATQGVDINNILEKITCEIGPMPQQIIPDPKRPIRQIAWCTGGAQDFFMQAVDAGVDLFITGEISERNFHEAQETGVGFIAAGHHATERFGAKALGEWINRNLSLTNQFIDVPNPV